MERKKEREKERKKERKKSYPLQSDISDVHGRRQGAHSVQAMRRASPQHLQNGGPRQLRLSLLLYAIVAQGATSQHGILDVIEGGQASNRAVQPHDAQDGNANQEKVVDFGPQWQNHGAINGKRRHRVIIVGHQVGHSTAVAAVQMVTCER